MKEYEEVWRNYEGYKKKYEEMWRKYVNKDSPYIWAEAFGKISSSSSYSGARVGERGAQFPGLGVPQRKDMKHDFIAGTWTGISKFQTHNI